MAKSCKKYQHKVKGVCKNYSWYNKLSKKGKQKIRSGTSKRKICKKGKTVDKISKRCRKKRSSKKRSKRSSKKSKRKSKKSKRKSKKSKRKSKKKSKKSKRKSKRSIKRKSKKSKKRAATSRRKAICSGQNKVPYKRIGKWWCRRCPGGYIITDKNKCKKMFISSEQLQDQLQGSQKPDGVIEATGDALVKVAGVPIAAASGITGAVGLTAPSNKGIVDAVSEAAEAVVEVPVAAIETVTGSIGLT